MTTRLFSTYSIVAADADEIGAAVQTHQMSVGSRVPWVRAGVGAVVTQSLINVSLGPLGLSLLEQGVSPERAVEALVASDSDASRRQLAVIDASGTAAAYTGDGCIREASHRCGYGYSVQANMMYTTQVVDAMAETFEGSDGPLAERMLLCLEAAQSRSGDIRGMQSAALVTVSTDPRTPSWEHSFDVRVDESNTPLADLGRLVRMRRAQHIDDRGRQALENGDVDGGIELFDSARELAPELEELGFWQALLIVELAPERIDEARRIFAGVRGDVAGHWEELIDRLEACGLVNTRGIRASLA